MKKIYNFLALFVLLTGALSCKDDFLDEVPLDFLAKENAFKTDADFNASTNNLYRLVRREFYTVNDFQPFHYLYRTDVAYDITVGTPNLISDYNPTTGIQNSHWDNFYKIIAETNTILAKIPNSSMSDASKTLFEAKAKFFRALAYRSLAYLFGGVPLVLEETGEKTNFVRATKKEVLTQTIEDLKFAAANLPALTTVKDGELTNLAAQHLLAEVYIADGQFQNAITAATIVIDDPGTDLMTSRFGSKATVSPGDPYWDLFQVRNQNRASGNKEGIWVIQMETDVIGGGANTADGSQNNTWALERVHAPLVRDMRVSGVAPFAWPVGDYTGGRGVGFLAPSMHFRETIWQSDYNNDIRNANHNFVRDFIGTNPLSPFFGKVVSTKTPPAGSTGISGAIVANKNDRAFYPYQSKATTPFSHPTGVYVNPTSTDPIKKLELKGSAGVTFRDDYMFRLAETYLLRAEAYLGLNNNTGAAATDINVVRARANALPVSPANVTIDYILDERMRELGVEEKRMLTLLRLGKWSARVGTLNPVYTTAIQPQFNLWPIPQQEIEKNRTGVLEQNPGYK